MRSKITLKTILLAVSVTLLNFVVPAQALEGDSSQTITGVIKDGIFSGDHSFSRLSNLLTFTGLDVELSQGGPYTIFAPTDKAFERYDLAFPNVLNDLMVGKNGADALKKVLLNHVIVGNITENDIEKMSAAKAGLENMDGQMSVFGSNDDYYTINGVNIIGTDNGANNGTVHVVDFLIIPAAP